MAQHGGRTTDSVVGYYFCVDDATGLRCNHGHVMLNENAVGSAFYNLYIASSGYSIDAWRKFIVCHETGHSFGLLHPGPGEFGQHETADVGCMAVATGDYDFYVRQHNIDHLNVAY